MNGKMKRKWTTAQTWCENTNTVPATHLGYLQRHGTLWMKRNQQYRLLEVEVVNQNLKTPQTTIKEIIKNSVGESLEELLFQRCKALNCGQFKAKSGAFSFFFMRGTC